MPKKSIALSLVVSCLLFVSFVSVPQKVTAYPGQGLYKHCDNGSGKQKLIDISVGCGPGWYNCSSCCGPSGEKRSCRDINPITLTYSNVLLTFYDNSLNVAHSWATAPEMKTGSSGVAFDQLVSRLIDFNFITQATLYASPTGVPVSYDATVTSAVTDLQKAFKITTKKFGTFSVATRDAFSKFILDLLAADFAAGDKVQKFLTVYPDGRISWFDPASIFTPLISPSTKMTPATVPVFFRQDTDGKVYTWDSQAKKWVSSTTILPVSPIAPSTTTPSVPIKGSLSIFSTRLSDVVNEVVSSFSTNTNLRVMNGTPSNIVAGIADTLRFLGFTDYVATSADTNLGPTLTGATKALDAFFGLSADDIFDSVETNTISNFNSKFTTAINTLPVNANRFVIQSGATNQVSSFNSADGRFSAPRNIAPPSGSSARSVSECVADWAPLVGLTAAIDACLGPAD